MKHAQGPVRGVVGRRVLTCLQAIDIGRLTSDPVFLVPGGFIAVTGQGPVDSNESSKTTFEAALSLVHGDPGWRQKSPQFPAYAAELLFNPPNAPTGARVRADVGFIAAVFADPISQDPDDGHLTVWIRIRRHDDPSFEVAVAPGVLLACGGSHAARIEDARRVWASLRGPKWGPQTYATALYGPGVSCLSYVLTRGGRSEQRATLLGSDVSQLSSEQIAWQLIDLAAMRHLFDNEAAQRMEFFSLSQQLKVKEQEVKQAQEAVAAYARQAEAISRRHMLLDLLAVARDRYVATTVLEALGTLEQLCADRAAEASAAEAAQRAVDEVTRRLEALDPAAVARQVALAADELGAASRARQPVTERAASCAWTSGSPTVISGPLRRPQPPGPAGQQPAWKPSARARRPPRMMRKSRPAWPPGASKKLPRTWRRCGRDKPAQPASGWIRPASAGSCLMTRSRSRRMPGRSSTRSWSRLLARSAWPRVTTMTRSRHWQACQGACSSQVTGRFRTGWSAHRGVRAGCSHGWTRTAS